MNPLLTGNQPDPGGQNTPPQLSPAQGASAAILRSGMVPTAQNMLGMVNPMASDSAGLISGLSGYNKAVGAFTKFFQNKYPGVAILPSDIHQAMEHYKTLIENEPHIPALSMSDLPEHQALVNAHDADMNMGNTEFPQLMQFLRRHLGGN